MNDEKLWYLNDTVEKAFDGGEYYPGPGPSFYIIAEEKLVFMPIWYFGPSYIVSGILYWPGPGQDFYLSSNVFLDDVPILKK